jgi:hypothetical protein
VSLKNISKPLRKRTGVFGPLENLKREEGRYSLRNWGKVIFDF